MSVSMRYLFISKTFLMHINFAVFFNLIASAFNSSTSANAHFLSKRIFIRPDCLYKCCLNKILLHFFHLFFFFFINYIWKKESILIYIISYLTRRIETMLQKLTTSRSIFDINSRLAVRDKQKKCQYVYARLSIC